MITVLWRRWLRIRLSTLLVAMFTVSALIGINLKPYAFYYPRPEWIEELKTFVVDSKEDPFGQRGLYGWPTPAYPSWNWCGNNVAEGEFPQWGHFFGNAASNGYIACNWGAWNTRALVVDAIANALVFIIVISCWCFGTRGFERLRADRKSVRVRNRTVTSRV